MQSYHLCCCSSAAAATAATARGRGRPARQHCSYSTGQGGQDKSHEVDVATQLLTVPVQAMAVLDPCRATVRMVSYPLPPGCPQCKTTRPTAVALVWNMDAHKLCGPVSANIRANRMTACAYQKDLRHLTTQRRPCALCTHAPWQNQLP